MKRLKSFGRISAATGVAIGVTLGQWITAWLQQYSLPPWFTLVLMLGIVILFSVIVKEGGENILALSKPLRRLLLGRRNVEGAWIEVTERSGELRYISLVRLEVEGGELRISGENFDHTGRRDGTFSSDMLVVKWPKIMYKFEAVRAEGKNPTYVAYGQIHFAERDGPPGRYHGFFLDFNEGTRNDFSGWRISDSEDLQVLDETRDFSKNLRILADKYVPRNPLLEATPETPAD